MKKYLKGGVIAVTVVAATGAAYRLYVKGKDQIENVESSDSFISPDVPAPTTAAPAP